MQVAGVEDSTNNGSDTTSERVWLLALAFVSVLVGALLLIPSRGYAVDIFGWALASVVPFSLVVYQRRAGVAHLQATGILPAPLVRWGSTVIVVVGIIFAALHSWRLALEVATAIKDALP